MGFGPSDRGPPHPARFGNPRGAMSSYIWTIAGVYLSSSGTGIAGATAYLFDASTWQWLGMTTTDANGNYTFHPPTNNYYRVVCDLPGSPFKTGITPPIVPT